MTETVPLLFWLKKLISLFLLPPLLPLLLTAAGLMLLSRFRRCGLTLAWSGLALTFLLSAPAGVAVLLQPLEKTPPLSLEQSRHAEAIVILGGGKHFNAPEFGGETVNHFTLQRLRYGAKLARETGLPLLVSGGTLPGKQPEAILMRDILENEFNVAVKWVEPASLDTRQNARNSARLLQRENIRHILLVTHANHMPRASREFIAEGFQVTAAPTVWLGRAPDGYPGERPRLLPSPAGALAGNQACHEWLGLLAYRLSR